MLILILTHVPPPPVVRLVILLGHPMDRMSGRFVFWKNYTTLTIGRSDIGGFSPNHGWLPGCGGFPVEICVSAR